MDKLKSSFLDSVLEHDYELKVKDEKKQKEVKDARMKLENYAKYVKEMHPPIVK